MRWLPSIGRITLTTAALLAATEAWSAPLSPFIPTMEKKADEKSPRTTSVPSRLPMLDNHAAWTRLPGAPANEETLPSWARQLAGPLPQATAQMLRLDALHRTGDRLDPKLRALMRWMAADANQCAYSKALAESDLKRAGHAPAGLVARDSAKLSPDEKTALLFAKKLTTDGASVTDEEVQSLIQAFGESKVVAMVALIAHACFQDRVLLALNPPIESDGPPPPVQAVFPHKRTPPMPPGGAPGSKGKAGGAPATTSEKPLGANLEDVAGTWKDQTFDDLLKQLNRQRERKARIRIPDWPEVEARLSADSWALRLPRVLWNRVCYGHQPELTDGWFDCVDAFRQETKFNRMLSQDIFWVVTRSINCFY